MDYQATESLKKISRWGKFLGYIFMIFGAFSALGGLFAMVVGAIPGVLQVFLGLYLYRSAKEADKLLHQMDENAIGKILDNYAKFLKLNGILMIISFIIMIIFFVFFGAVMYEAYTTL